MRCGCSNWAEGPTSGPRCLAGSNPEPNTSWTAPSSFARTSKSPARAMITRGRENHACTHHRPVDPLPMGGHGARPPGLRHRRLELPAPADRRHSGHHQRPDSDQHRSPRLFAAGGRTAHHLPRRDRRRRRSGPSIHPLGFAIRVEPGDRHLRRRHRHLFRTPTGE